MERNFIMKKTKFLATIISILVASAPHLTPVSAIKTAIPPVDSKLSSTNDTATADHIAFLREFKTLASSCDYDPYFNYEAEETKLMGRSRLNTDQVNKLSKKDQGIYLKQSHEASLQIVKDQHHGICRHFCTCVVELCKKYGIEFQIIATRKRGHSAVVYKFGDHGYVADMLLQVARNKNLREKDPCSEKAEKISGDRSKLINIMVGIGKDIIAAKKLRDPGVVDDPVINALDDTKGMEYGRIPIQIYLHNVALPLDENYYCDELFRSTAGFLTPLFWQ